jgi:hypothetical protein
MTRIRVWGDGEVTGVGETADGRDDAPPARWGDGFGRASGGGVVGVRGDDGRREARAAALGGERGVRMGSGREGVGQGVRMEARESGVEGGTGRRAWTSERHWWTEGRTHGRGGRGHTGEQKKVLTSFFSTWYFLAASASVRPPSARSHSNFAHDSVALTPITPRSHVTLAFDPQPFAPRRRRRLYSPSHHAFSPIAPCVLP